MELEKKPIQEGQKWFDVRETETILQNELGKDSIPIFRRLKKYRNLIISK